jgi:hypothetical protein
MSGSASALAAFLRAAIRPQTPLARAIVAALALKLCVVIAMRAYLIGTDAVVPVDEAAMSRLIAPAPTRSLP